MEFQIDFFSVKLRRDHAKRMLALASSGAVIAATACMGVALGIGFVIEGAPLWFFGLTTLAALLPTAVAILFFGGAAKAFEGLVAGFTEAVESVCRFSAAAVRVFNTLKTILRLIRVPSPPPLACGLRIGVPPTLAPRLLPLPMAA